MWSALFSVLALALASSWAEDDYPCPAPMTETEIRAATKPLLRYYSAVNIKHAYYPDSNSVRSIYTFPYHYSYEGTEGNVLPYDVFEKNKDAINQTCPDLVVYKNVYEDTLLNLPDFYDQSFYRLSSPIGGRIDAGPIFVAAPSEGYCGAHTAMYLTDSNRPVIKDWFYTTDKYSYESVTTSNTFYNHGTKYGVAFWVW